MLPGCPGNAVCKTWPAARRKVDLSVPSTTIAESPIRSISIRPIKPYVPTAGGTAGAHLPARTFLHLPPLQFHARAFLEHPGVGEYEPTISQYRRTKPHKRAMSPAQNLS